MLQENVVHVWHNALSRYNRWDLQCLTTFFKSITCLHLTCFHNSRTLGKWCNSARSHDSLVMDQSTSIHVTEDQHLSSWTHDGLKRNHESVVPTLIFFCNTHANETNYHSTILFLWYNLAEKYFFLMQNSPLRLSGSVAVPYAMLWSHIKIII